MIEDLFKSALDHHKPETLEEAGVLLAIYIQGVLAIKRELERRYGKDK